MRSADVTQSEIFSYRTLEQRIPASHPLRKLRVVVDGILAALHADFEALYAKTGRPSIPPECQSARNFDHASALNFDQATETISGA